MKNLVLKYLYSLRFLGVFAIALLSCENIVAQLGAPPNGALPKWPFGDRKAPHQPRNVSLPEQRGATVYSSGLNAQASNRLAAGSYLESLATANLTNGYARLAHVEASRAEVQYHVERVTAFFDLRRINKEYRAEMYSSTYERADKADKLMDSLISDQPEYVLQQLDIAGRLNWMFKRLTNRLYQDELVNGTAEFGGADFSQKMSLQHIRQIYVESTELIDGERIRTLLIDTNSGHQKLPPVFSMTALQGSSDNYIVARQLILNTLKDEDPKTPSFQQWETIYDSLEQLQRALGAAIPVQQRSIPRALNEYLSGKRFIKSQAAAMIYVNRTGRGEQLIGGDTFDGQSIGEILDFMVGQGLQFGRPESGGRASYEALFYMLRTAYLNE